MTTIIITANAIAFDHQATHTGGRIERLKNVKKVIQARDKDGRDCYIGGCGSLEILQMFQLWFSDARIQMPSHQECEDYNDYFEGFCFYPDTEELYTYSTRLFPLEQDLPYAMGSGSDYALAVLEAGLNIEKACEVAGKLDAGTSTDFTIIKFKKPRVRKNAK